jgi:hypothetical protein
MKLRYMTLHVKSIDSEVQAVAKLPETLTEAVKMYGENFVLDAIQRAVINRAAQTAVQGRPELKVLG